jgi:hypothetical protein
MAAVGRSRIAESYVQIIPVVGNLTSQLTEQIESAMNSSQMSQSTANAGQQIGADIGDNAGQTAGEGMGKQIIGALAAAGIGAFLSGQISKALDMGEVDAKIGAQLDLTAKQLETVTGATEGLFGGGYGEYEAISETMKAIVGSYKGARDMSKEQLQLMGRDMINLSKTTGWEASEIATAVQTMTGSGLSKNSADAMQTLLMGYQNLGEKGGEIGEIFAEFSDDWHNLGLDGPESIKLLKASLDAGAKSTETFSDAFNELGIKIGDASADEGLAAIGISGADARAALKQGGDVAQAMLTEITGRLQKANDRGLWQQVFGTQAEDFYSAFQKVDLSVINNGVLAADGNLAKLDERFTTVKAVVDSLTATFELAFAKTLKPLIEDLSPHVKGFAGFIQNNADAAKALSVVVGGVMVAAVAVLTAGLWAMIAPIVANPATWILAGVLAAVLAVGGGIWWLTKNWDDVNAWMTNTWSGFVGFMEDSSGNIYTTFEEMGKNISEVFNGIVYGVITAINEMIKAVNSVQFDMPGWLGGGHWDGLQIGLLEVPKFGKGGTIAPRVGGTLGILAEEGRFESVVDTANMNTLINNVNDKFENGLAGGKSVSITINPPPGMSIPELVREIDDYRELHGV